MSRILCFESGPATLLDPSYIEEFGREKGMLDELKIIQVSNDHRLFLEGEFGKFRIYCLTSHTRPEVIPDSVRLLSSDHFSAMLELELMPGEVSRHEVVFRLPYLSIDEVKSATYGLYPDSFAFIKRGFGPNIHVCDLSFLTLYAENAPLIPLKVEYIGIAKAEAREAPDRLGEGHEKLQKLLANQNRRPSRRSISIVLYRPSELEPPVLPFPDVVEAIEATMIRHFRPTPMNVRRIDFPADSPELVGKIRALGAGLIYNELASPKGTQLYSEQIVPSSIHTIAIRL